MAYLSNASPARIALRFLMKMAGALQDVSKLRYQAVFLVGAGGSGKGFVGQRWMKYMPGGGGHGTTDPSMMKRKLDEQERSLTNLNFEKAVKTLQQKGIKIELSGHDVQIPFQLYTYDHQGHERLIDPRDWKDTLPISIYNEVEGLKSVIFNAPVHELPSYWRQVNPDIYKEELAGYLEKEPGYVHEMSSDMSKAYFEAILETGDPLFVDGTGANDKKMVDQIKAAKSAGYKVSLVLVIVPLTVNQIRNATRPRNVDPMVLVGQYKSIANNFATLRSLADKSKVIVNRNDQVDISLYKKHKDEINNLIRRKTRYQNLHDLIAAEAPQEMSDWGGLLSDV